MMNPNFFEFVRNYSLIKLHLLLLFFFLPFVSRTCKATSYLVKLHFIMKIASITQCKVLILCRID